MADKSLFASPKSRHPRADTRNEAGGPAYALEPKHALAQLAATGCFGGTYYAQAEEQLDTLKALVDQVDDNVFLARLALYGRRRALMKDMPVALLVALSKRDTRLFHQVFDRVVDNGRTLRTLVQMVRSGRFGRRSLSYALQRAVQRWLNTASVEKLLSASIGHDPSLRDVLRLARPTPPDNARRALYGWLADRPVDKWVPATEADLPEEVQTLLAFRRADSAEEQLLLMDRVRARWDLLADAARGPEVWKALCRKMGLQALRMNLNTLARHEVFGPPATTGWTVGRALVEGLGISPAPPKADDLVDYVAAQLADPEEVRRSRQFPYQFLAAYLHAGNQVPQKIKAALHRAAEIACGNVPALPGPVVIGLDVSGSMTCPATGYRGRGGTSKMRCVDVAALFAAAILRRNPDSVIIPFDTTAYEVRIDPNDSVLSLAERLAGYGGGGTDCALPLSMANSRYRNRRFAGAVLVSDQESWVRAGQPFGYGSHGSTGVMTEWQAFVANQRRLGMQSPKLVCIDLQPYTTTQAPERPDILNIGGFSDAVFSVVAAFLADDHGRFVAEVEAVEL